MTIDIQALKAAAEAATPGPWTAYAATDDLHPVRAKNGRIVADVGYSGTLDRDVDNAAYIASASPNVILSMIAELEQLRAALDAQGALTETYRDLAMAAASAKPVEQEPAKLTIAVKALEEISAWKFGWDGDCGVTRVAYDVLAAIELAAPQAQQAAPSWINVKDRLPEVGQGVIAYRPTAPQTQDDAMVITFFSGREQESWQGVKHQFDCLCHPSHWMPLPAAPEVQP